MCAGEEPQEVRTLVEVQSETSKDMKDAQAHLDQNVLGQLRRGSLGLDSGLSGSLFSAAGTRRGGAALETGFDRR